jgi:hypothetical protein
VLQSVPALETGAVPAHDPPSPRVTVDLSRPLLAAAGIADVVGEEPAQPRRHSDILRAPYQFQIARLLGVLSLLLGSLALLASSFPSYWNVPLPASAAGVALALVGLYIGGAGKLPWLWPAAGLAVSFVVCLLAAFWPGVLGMEARRPAGNQTRDQLLVVPIKDDRGKAARPPTDSEWTDLSRDAVHKGDLRLALVSAGIQPVTFKDQAGKQTPTKERYLVIEIRLSNMAVNTPLPYTSWGERSLKDAPVLADNRGRTYALVDLGPEQSPMNHVKRATIGPLKAIRDVLVFEAPTAELKYLHLELPGAAFGAGGKLQLEIPGRLVQSR